MNFPFSALHQKMHLYHGALEEVRSEFDKYVVDYESLDWDDLVNHAHQIKNCRPNSNGSSSKSDSGSTNERNSSQSKGKWKADDQGDTKATKKKWCDHHNSGGHWTADCNVLKDTKKSKN